MRKLSILLVLAILTTIGGVYATWDYAESSAEAVEKTATVSITLANSSTPSGIIKIHNTLALIVDDEGTNLGKPKYTPGWDDYTKTMGTGGTLDLEFEPATGASEVTLEYTIIIKNNTYTDTEAGNVAIFTYDPVAGEADNVVAKGTFTCGVHDPEKHQTWSYDQFTELLRVNDAFQVDTLDQYNAYAAAVKGVELVIYVKEV